MKSGGLPWVDCPWAQVVLPFQPVLECPRRSKAPKSNGIYEQRIHLAESSPSLGSRVAWARRDVLSEILNAAGLWWQSSSLCGRVWRAHGPVAACTHGHSPVVLPLWQQPNTIHKKMTRQGLDPQGTSPPERPFSSTVVNCPVTQGRNTTGEGCTPSF